MKKICKCHHQKYLDTKSIINNINKSNCLEQKCKLIIEKNNDNIETFIEYKIDGKVARIKKQNPLEKQIHVRNHHQRNQQVFTKFREIFTIVKKIIMKKITICTESNIANNNNEDNRLRNNGSNIENGINESTVTSNQGKLALILGDSMVKDINGYLLTGSINRKFIEKVRPFSSAKAIDMEDYTKPTKRNFKPDLYILHLRKNDLSLDGTPEVMSSRTIDTAKSLITEKTK